MQASNCNAFCFRQQHQGSHRGSLSFCTNIIRTNTAINAERKEEDKSNNNRSDIFLNNRRGFLDATAGACAAVTMLSLPESALAGIDVSGLKVEGGGVAAGNSVLKEQLKSIDGSGSARVSQIKDLSAPPPPSAVRIGGVPIPVEEKVDSGIATWLYRKNPSMAPQLSRSGALRNLFRCDDQVVGPNGSGSVGITFEFPSDWLQLDKFLGGISYVDQRNGDRLYLLKTKLPDGERLATVPKSFFGPSIFDPKGTIVKSQGVEIDEYKVSSSTTINECPDNSCATHKRYKIKYSTVTGNGLRVERRALLDAYEMTSSGDIYMMMTTSNAVKFEKKDSPERQTVEAIVDSFLINI